MLPTLPEESAAGLTDRAHGFRYRDPGAAVAMAARALEAARSEGNTPVQVRALRVRAGCLIRLADLDAAMRDLDEAEALIAASGDETDLLGVLAARASIHWQRGELAHAMSVAQRALAPSTDTADQAGLAEALNIAGAIAMSRGDLAHALELFHSCRVLREAEGDPGGLGVVLCNIAIIHGRLGEHERAVTLLDRALALLREAHDPADEAIVHLNLGISQAALGRLDEAMRHAEAGLALARDLGARRTEVQALTNIAEMHLAGGRAETALRLLEEANAIAAGLQLRAQDVEIRTRLGQAALALGNLEAAARELALAMEAAQREDSVHRHEVHLALSRLHEARGDFARALEHHRLYHEAEGAIRGEQASQRIRAAMVQAEMEQAERDAKLLREHNESLRRANEEKSRLLELLSAQAAELERLSLEDALTGLPNRRHFDAQLAREWDRSQRFDHPLTIALIDVDHFKQVNDTFGHDAGDAALRAVAAQLRVNRRKVDIVARYGGEEFALVLIETPQDAAFGACEALRERIAAMDASAIAPGLRLTVSIGLASADEVPSIAALLARADERLYAAKRAGRNTVAGAAVSR